MTDRELLRRIRDIRNSLGDIEAETYEDQVTELESILEQQQSYKAEIDGLTAKLDNPRENYLLYSAEDREGHVQKINAEIDRMRVEEEQNESELTNITRRIQLIDSEVANSLELMEIGRNEEATYNGIDTSSKTTEEIADIQDKIQRTKAAVADIDAYAQELTSEKEELLQMIENLNTRQTQLTERRQRYQTTLDRAQSGIPAGEIWDSKQMETDRDHLEQAKEVLKSLNVRGARLSFDANSSLKSLEESIRIGDMPAEGIVERLRYIQSRVPFLPTNMPEEISHNQVTQKAYKQRIEELEKKLSDDQNYVFSATSFDRLNKEIVALEFRLTDYNAKMKEEQATYARLENEQGQHETDLQAYEKSLAALESNIATIQLSLTDPMMPKRVRREQEKMLRNYQKEANNTRKILSTLYEEKANVQTMMQSIQQNQKRLPKLYNMTEKMLEQKRQRLEDKSTIDEYAKRMDEDKLHSLTSGLVALQTREKWLLDNTADQFDEIIRDIESKGLTHESGSIKKGIGVVFEKIKNSKLMKKITSMSFKNRIKAGIAAVILIGASAGCASRLQGSSVKLDEKGLSKGKLSVMGKLPFDKLTNVYQIKIDDAIYEIEEEKPALETTETNEVEQAAVDTPQMNATEKASIEEVVMEVIRGKWGNGEERKDNLRAAGYTDEEIAEIQRRVNAYYHVEKPTAEQETPVVNAPIMEAEQTPVVDTKDDVTEPDVAPEPGPVMDSSLGEPVLPPENTDVPEVNPDEFIPGTITPGPVYTIEGDEEIISEEFHPITPQPVEPSDPIVTPTPDPEPEPIRPSRPSSTVRVKPGDTLVVETEDGKVAVDNSEGANFQDMDKDTSLDYTSSDAIDGVHYNDADNSVEVSVNPDNVVSTPEAPAAEDQAKINQQILDDYEQILREMGISSTVIEDTGRTR